MGFIIGYILSAVFIGIGYAIGINIPKDNEKHDNADVEKLKADIENVFTSYIKGE